MTSFILHILAMLFMLMDHMWATILPGELWMTCVGRIAFPIFAFTVAEGASRTHDIKKYLKRMLVFAVISEVPFDFMCEGVWLYPFHQNVMWTFSIAIVCIILIEKYKKLPVTALVCLCGFGAGYLFMVDYYGYGVLTVLAFYLLHNKKWYGYVLQAAAMFCFHYVGLAGQCIILGNGFEFPIQGLALLALPFIWLYNGKQGPYNKVIKYIYYGFYPAHMLVLYLLYLVKIG